MKHALLALSSILCGSALAAESTLTPLKYNNPGLTVDLGVGLWAWPLPMDFDGDGDLDLVVNCPDKPYNGIYFFENASGDTSKNKMPVFKPARRISAGCSSHSRELPSMSVNRWTTAAGGAGTDDLGKVL